MDLVSARASRKKLFYGEIVSSMVVMPWHRFPRAALAPPSLTVSKAKLHRNWSNLG